MTSSKAIRLAKFSLTTTNANRLATFYERSMGCIRVSKTELRGADLDDLLAIRGGAHCIRLALGDEIIELLEFENPGAPYPPQSSAADLIFQHFAIVVTDMAQAWLRLSRTEGWSPITQGLPQRLPDSSGGVTAFKFRDPEGHPLELLSFPASKVPKKWSDAPARQTSLGIDHSAVSAANAAASTVFYEALGLRVTAHSLNTGPAQDALDSMPSVEVAVVALSPKIDTPHVELLCYQEISPRRGGNLQSNDIACTRLIFDSVGDGGAQRLLDPDGHHLILRATPSQRQPL